MSTLQASIEELTEIQRRAVEWQDGPMLALASSGTSRTDVLTCRVARILASSADKRFRVLALTVTNKSAAEMRHRVSAFVPRLYKRATIGTFHAFCEQVLRQQGVHIGIDSGFDVFSLDADRVAVFRDALRRAEAMGQNVSNDDERYLGQIERLQSRGETVEIAGSEGSDNIRIQWLRRLYDEELRRVNALDLNSMITETCRLFTTYPELSKFYQRSYRYCLIDEFQGITKAQYMLILSMAAHGFRNIFAVADDDQKIYKGNAENLEQIRDFELDFDPKILQI